MSRQSAMAGAAPTSSAGNGHAHRGHVNILLVDDQPSNLLALEAILDDLGQNLIKARSGADALRHLLNTEVALILLDVQMPGMDGFETASLIHGRQKTSSTPIIFLTAYERNDMQMFEGYSVGAVDYMVKPLVPEILRSKVAVFVELFRKTEQVKQQEAMLRENERREHERELTEANERLEAERLRGEIRIAREIQQRLFPVAAAPLSGFDIGGASYPAEATGGDYFDYIPMPQDGLGIVIGDISGHGLGPALLMAETRAYLHALMLTRHDVGEIVALVNQALVRDLADEHFTTLFLARIDPAARSFVYVNAGHPTGYVLDAHGGVKTLLPSTGMALGIVPDLEFPAAPAISLEPGELVLLLTDGVLEAPSAQGAAYGIERTLEVVCAHRGEPARAIVDILYRDVGNYCRGTTQLDDITAVVIKVGNS